MRKRPERIGEDYHPKHDYPKRNAVNYLA